MLLAKMTASSIRLARPKVSKRAATSFGVRTPRQYAIRSVIAMNVALIMKLVSSMITVAAAVQVVIAVKSEAVVMILAWPWIASNSRLRVVDCEATPSLRVKRVSDFPPIRKRHISPKACVGGQNVPTTSRLAPNYWIIFRWV